MNFYLATGNSEIKKRILQQFSQMVAIDWTKLQELNQPDCDEICCIAVIHDEENPIDTYGEKPGWFFNEMRDAKPGEFKGDYYVNLAQRSIDEIIHDIRELIARYELAQTYIHNIVTSAYTVRWNSWVFNGGRDYDYTQYDVLAGDEKIGSISIDADTYEFTLNFAKDNLEIFSSTWLSRSNKPLGKYLEKVLQVHCMKDDPEFVSAITVDGQLIWPCGFLDFSREEVISREYLEAMC